MSLMRAFEIGSTGLVAQSIRLNTTASNIANVESVSGPDGRPYRARQVEFSSVYKAGQPGAGVEVSKIIESNAPMRIEYRPGHPKANAAGYVEMPNVNPVEEMVNMILGQRAYEASSKVIKAADEMLADAATITGSIGVIMGTYNLRGLMDKVGVVPMTFTSGRYKDMLSMSKEPANVYTKNLKVACIRRSPPQRLQRK